MKSNSNLVEVNLATCDAKLRHIREISYRIYVYLRYYYVARITGDYDMQAKCTARTYLALNRLSRDGNSGVLSEQMIRMYMMEGFKCDAEFVRESPYPLRRNLFEYECEELYQFVKSYVSWLCRSLCRFGSVSLDQVDDKIQSLLTDKVRRKHVYDAAYSAHRAIDFTSSR